MSGLTWYWHVDTDCESGFRGTLTLKTTVSASGPAYYYLRPMDLRDVIDHELAALRRVVRDGFEQLREDLFAKVVA